ncbi:DUF3772 domain-containing protein [Methylobacterium sp. J-068]|uniref:DUF3772 domain-containing protein n=1 Tax=Methylobacterium sp. J-068 TaxID=2836649 RepID=UPI001FBA893E|nr:DUF3772 domain-containing protein [Methylobacterium sp. J-068]MCJ2034918.1 DUF3772 domain-containing protein [Methylobacterium sp. J-068]
MSDRRVARGGMIGRLAGRLALAAMVLATTLPTLSTGSLAQSDARADLRRALTEITTELPLRQSDFKGLSTLRDRTEALIAESREMRAESAAALRRARTTRLEAAKVEGAPERDDATRAADAALSSVEARNREDGKVAGEIEDAWNRITEFRRQLFAKRLLDYSLSPLSPAFWNELVDRALPQVGGKLRDLGAAISADEEFGDWEANVFVCLFLLLVGASLYVATRWVSRRVLARWHRFALRAHVGPRRRAAVHALIDMTFTVFSIPLTIVLLIVLNDGVDFTPGSADSIALRVLGAIAGYLIGTGVLRAMVAPRDAAYRLLAVGDRTASIVVRTGRALILVYAADLIFGEFAIAAHFRVVISEASTMVMVTTCCALLAVALLRLSQAEPATDPDAMPAATSAVHLLVLTPLVWIVVAASLASVLAGFTALGGFLIGRLIVTGLLLALGWVMLICVNALFVTRGDIERSARLARLSRTLALQPDSLALGSVILSGVLNVVVIAAMVFVVVGPWNLAYGEFNPFRDAFLGYSLVDLRGLIGSAGLAVITAVVGVVLTQVGTGWLDREVLPQTRLDAGARYSVITVVGYGGLVITVLLALGQLGVNPQSLTVIAGALSVGVGFGLQSIVSNFVSGLIVLAERPIRVGDVVSVKGEEGRVRKISVRSTLIATGDRTDLIVPNTDLITSIVRNKTLTDVSQRLRMPMVLDRDADMVLVRDALIAVAARHPNVAAEPAPVLLLTKIGENLELEARVFLLDGALGDTTRSELNFVLLELFRRSGIKLGTGSNS